MQAFQPQSDLKQHWWQTDLGAYVLAQEQALLCNAISDVFGFYALQIGLPWHNYLLDSRIPNRWLADQTAGDFYCEPEYLPFAENALDLICLPHTLEFSANPHQVLREVARVLVPDGQVILTGFNPYSAFGFKFATTRNTAYPWHAQMLSMTRLRDWLALLGLELMQAEMTGYAWPAESDVWFNRLNGLDKIGRKCWPLLGGIYMIKAKKRVVHLNVLKPNWTKNKLKTKLATNAPKPRPQSQKTRRKPTIADF